jgi:hypothetical protein
VIALKQLFLICVVVLIKGVCSLKISSISPGGKGLFQFQITFAEDFKIIRVARFLYGLNKNLFQRSSNFSTVGHWIFNCYLKQYNRKLNKAGHLSKNESI